MATEDDPTLEAIMVEFGKLVLEPGDVLLIRVDSRVRTVEGARENIETAIKRVFPSGTPWLLHDEYAEFTVAKDPANTAGRDGADEASDDDPPTDGDPDEGSEGAALPAEAEHV